MSETFKAQCECGEELVSHAAAPLEAAPGGYLAEFGPCPRCGGVFSAEWRGGMTRKAGA